MISRLAGVLLEKKPPLVLVDVQGVGYEIWCSLTTHGILPDVGASVVLHTHFLVREDAQLLYGFATQAERVLFRELIKINGVGPRVALTILSGYCAQELFEIIKTKNLKALTRLSGIGQKTGERLLLELGGRVEGNKGLQVLLGLSGDDFEGRLSSPKCAPVSGAGAGSPMRAEAIEALEALGYKSAEAQRAVGRVTEAETTTQAMIKAALRQTA